MKVRNIGGMILAGGKNRRMEGKKKLFLEYEGRTFLDILKERLSGMQPVYLSVESKSAYQAVDSQNSEVHEKSAYQEADYQSRGIHEKSGHNIAHLTGDGTDISGLQLVEDLYPGIGPIGGIASVLSACKEDAIFVAACDMPFLKEETIERLCDACERHPDQIIIPKCKERLHPLCGIYPRSALPMIKEQIAVGDYRMQNLLRKYPVHFVIFPEDDPSFRNINTVSEYRQLRGSGMLEIEEAVSVLTEAVRPIGKTENVSLMEASGRTLAEDITAPMNQPPFPRSPLDGYAVRGADTAGASKEDPVPLKVIGKIYAGETFSGKIEKNECVRLMTGAPIPDGADTVIRQEDTDYGEKEVQIYQEVSPYQNYCYAGEDYQKGELLVPKGTLLSGISIGVIAGTGRQQVAVFREPEVTVISTGDEVVAPGNALKPGKIYDSNRYLVTGRLQDLGLKHSHSNHCEDEVEEMCRLIRDASQHSDLIITTGGVSVGEKDIMHQVQEQLHGRKLFWRVNLKPGAPTLAFVVDDTLVICLTGNPYGVAVNFELLVRPVLAKLTGNEKWLIRRQICVLQNDSPKRGGVRRFMRGYYTPGTAGRLTEPTPDHMANDSIASEVSSAGTVRILDGNHAAGTLATMVSCNCLVEIPEEGSGKKGENVWIYPL